MARAKAPSSSGAATLASAANGSRDGCGGVLGEGALDLDALSHELPAEPASLNRPQAAATATPPAPSKDPFAAFSKAGPQVNRGAVAGSRSRANDFASFTKAAASPLAAAESNGVDWFEAADVSSVQGGSLLSPSASREPAGPAAAMDPFAASGNLFDNGFQQPEASMNNFSSVEDIFGTSFPAAVLTTAATGSSTSAAAAAANLDNMFTGTSSGAPVMDPFVDAFGAAAVRNVRPRAAATTIDPLEALLMGTSGSSAAGNSLASRTTATTTTVVAAEDWGDFAVTADGTTHELEGLPPPPVGLVAGVAAARGIELHRAGQFADAIKWLIWAAELARRGGSSGSVLKDALVCRSACYKEAGELKKAVADCSEVLEMDPGDVAVLMQRAILYETMEKYKLGVVDLQEVTRRDPSNRSAGAILARLNRAVRSG
eukprot:SM000086S23029  [mRNA]  locus=s86:183981:185930:- [translate_table: standard]